MVIVKQLTIQVIVTDENGVILSDTRTQVGDGKSVLSAAPASRVSKKHQILAYLSNHRGSQYREIATATAINAGTVSTMLSGMKSEGLVTNEDLGRNKWQWSITSDGLAFLADS